MSKRQSAKEIEKQEAINTLREWIKPGDTVYTVLDSVSRSGMSRRIRVVLITPEGPLHPNYSVSKALGIRQKGAALVVTGCGMDMGFSVVYNLSSVLYPDYACLGERCPSPDHHSNQGNAPRTTDGTVVHKDGYALNHRWL